jgi:hypothetical protein
MRRIAILWREGHQIGDDLKEGLTHLRRTHISTHIGRGGQGYAIFWIHENLDCVIALRLLRDLGLEAVEFPLDHAIHSG